MRTTVAEGFEYEPEQVWLPVSEAILDWDTDFHRLLLTDHIRMTAFRAAVNEAVEPGMVVLDLGTGTGILAQWALEAGAARVYGIELNDVILRSAIERIITAGHGARFRAVRGLSFDVELPERVDLIISEVLGNIADNEDCVSILADARSRFLKNDGRILPRRVESYLVPVAAEKAHSQVENGECRPGTGSRQLDDVLRQRGRLSRFDFYYDAIVPRGTYLAAPRVARDYAFEDGDDEPTYHLSTVFTAQREGVFTGFKGYFIATLSQTVSLDISGDDIDGRTTSDSWKHCYLPIEEPVKVQAHDRITLAFSRRYPPGVRELFRQHYRWEGQVIRENAVIAHFAQDTGGQS